jgi:hypothetical protein
VLLGVLALVVGACAYANGYDPARYANPAPAASVDPEIEPLAPSPKKRMRDPRGTTVVKAEPLDASAAAPDAALPLADAGLVAPVVVVTPAPAPAVAGTAATCGSKADPCPMQRFMHGALATAHTADTLTAAFTRVAGMSPDPSWAWVAIATRGADLANAGDLRAAKGQCTACHDAYRETYRTLHRAKKL